MVVRVREHPLRGALKDGQPPDVLGDRRGELKSGGTGADHDDVLAVEVDAVVPARGVERRTGEASRARKIRYERLVQLTHGADDRTRAQNLSATIRSANGERPVAGVVVPDRGDDLGVEPDVLGHAVTLHHIVEVVLQFGLAREELRPVVRGFEAVAVEMVADVHPGAGIAVLPPGSTHTGVLLDHGVGHASLVEPDRGQQAGLTGTDHDDRELGAGLRGGVQLALAGVAAVESHLLEHHRHVLVAHLTGDQPGHHLLEAGRVDGRRFRTATVAVVANDTQGEGARGSLVVLGHVALYLVEEQPRRPERTFQDRLPDRLVVGHVHTRQQQRRDRHVLQCGGDLVV